MVYIWLSELADISVRRISDEKRCLCLHLGLRGDGVGF